MLTQEAMQELMQQVFGECSELGAAGQAEYAGGENALGNFERLASTLSLSREQVLMVYLTKHIDGITAWVRGHKSQREDVRGRINDAIVYLCLLRGMVEEGERPAEPERIMRPDPLSTSWPPRQATGD